MHTLQVLLMLERFGRGADTLDGGAPLGEKRFHDLRSKSSKVDESGRVSYSTTYRHQPSWIPMHSDDEITTLHSSQ